MIQTIELKVLPEIASNSEHIQRAAALACGVSAERITYIRHKRRNIDARSRQPFYVLTLEIYIDENPPVSSSQPIPYKMVEDSPHTAIIIGAGPAGYFAALTLLELGIRPIVLDRGKDVQSRRRDLRAIQQFSQVNPHSNYCFGEGGAGTYSDGKLYTRSNKRGNIAQTLQVLVEHGAPADILIDAHPHIGSNKLPQVVANIRQTILQYGGEVHFEHWVSDIIIKNKRAVGVVVAHQKELLADAVIIATGHSARDIFYLLHNKGIAIEAKPFALGVRVEHPQTLIDNLQYHRPQRGEHLPAASYQLACQVGNKGVFSFCMCPGGLIVPAATSCGEIVVNGMSMSRRDSPYANSGVAISIDPEELTAYAPYGVFAGLAFQQEVERSVWAAGDGSQRAPAQLLPDFIRSQTSQHTIATSYIPGVYSAPLHELLPPFVAKTLQQGFRDFEKKMRGYVTADAQIVATESRTSSPIRIPRSTTTYMHHQVEGLYPCGEGAGYAGGIISAAMDGQNVARALGGYLKPTT